MAIPTLRFGLAPLRSAARNATTSLLYTAIAAGSFESKFVLAIVPGWLVRAGGKKRYSLQHQLGAGITGAWPPPSIQNLERPSASR